MKKIQKDKKKKKKKKKKKIKSKITFLFFFKKKDAFRLEFLIVPCVLLAFIATYEYEPFEVSFFHFFKKIFFIQKKKKK